MKHLFRLTPAGLSSALIGPGCDKKQMDRLEEDYKTKGSRAVNLKRAIVGSKVAQFFIDRREPNKVA